jgi:hypothetical protein
VFKSYMDITNIAEEANEREIIRQLLLYTWREKIKGLKSLDWISKRSR